MIQEISSPMRYTQSSKARKNDERKAPDTDIPDTLLSSNLFP